MELRHLRYFIASAEEEHFGRASERLCVTRPAVSQIIANLEDELGVQLFERHAHKIKLTAAGAAFLPRLKALMIELEEAVVLTQRIGQGKSGALILAYGSLSLYHPILRAAVKEYREQYPDVTLSFIEMPTSEQTKALADGRIHIGFMHFGPQAPTSVKGQDVNQSNVRNIHLDHYSIQSGGLGVVVYKDHPLAKRKSVSLAELANEQFVVVPNSSISPGYGHLFTLCKEAGFEPRITQEVRTIASQLNLISVGLGIGLSVIGPHFTYPHNLSVIKLSDLNYETSFQIGWRNDQVEPALAQFIDIVKKLSA
ncbi:LysR family transcriptional regulator [Advenella mimigardefordensis]|uniref:Transcriptional regulator, LysR family n=1 Tax=Advenella mimigardefordensis (strain DSM 17166 / LMG 22922 / DPN7) TaxID=1247726 RepID=W0PFM2_ADVMD|nr:LysR substrate-binding domain-containing protein [Advenella mimigardefordensis]AHG64090.1 transcriptional regulator, LysR family [Advenella mimigardefordensis DPN7]